MVHPTCESFDITLPTHQRIRKLEKFLQVNEQDTMVTLMTHSTTSVAAASKSEDMCTTAKPLLIDDILAISSML